MNTQICLVKLTSHKYENQLKKKLMKNLITFCVIFLTTTLMISSCGSSLSITKRQHTKGYYVSHNNVKSNNKTVSTEKIETSEANIENVKIDNETAAISSKETTTFTSAMTATDVVENNSIEEEVTVKVSETKEANTNVTERKELVPSAIKNTASKFKNVYSESKSKYAPAEGDAHSLLWIIVVVILILWLLGYLGGYGATSGLIHLLLVIALILFILWLLRII